MAGYYPPESFYPPAKRIRPNPPPTSTPSGPSLHSPSRTATASPSTPTPTPPRSITPIEAAVLSLPPPTLKAILLLSAQNHPDIAAQLYAAHNELILAEAQQVIDFDHLSKTAWHALNPRYGGSGARAYEMALDAGTEVDECISTIAEAANKHGASFGTRRNALESLRKIGKSVLLAEGIMGHEVRKELAWREGVDAVMVGILRGMSGEERDVCRGELEDKVRELRELDFRVECWGRFDEVLALLCGEEMVESQSQDSQNGVSLGDGMNVPTVVTNHHH